MFFGLFGRFSSLLEISCTLWKILSQELYFYTLCYLGPKNCCGPRKLSFCLKISQFCISSDSFFWGNHFEYPSHDMFYSVAKVTRHGSAELDKTMIAQLMHVTPALLRDF